MSIGCFPQKVTGEVAQPASEPLSGNGNGDIFREELAKMNNFYDSADVLTEKSWENLRCFADEDAVESLVPDPAFAGRPPQLARSVELLGPRKVSQISKPNQPGRPQMQSFKQQRGLDTPLAPVIEDGDEFEDEW